MNKSKKIILVILFCITFTSCLFDYHEHPSSAVFKDDKTIEYTWDPLLKDTYTLLYVQVESERYQYFLEERMRSGTIHLSKEVEEGKIVTLVFKSGSGDKVYYLFKKEKENNYPMVRWYYE